MNRGIVYALAAYVFWGLHPIYWKQLSHVPSLEIVSHRVFWSFCFFVLILSLRRGWKELARKIRTGRNKWILFGPAFLIGSNWGMYIWAVNTGFIIETSLGYFICPLISVFLGVVFLHEKLRKLQWWAVGIATAGVLIMTVLYGQFPWISLYLAVTWGAYGLLRKKSPLGSVEGLTLETGVLSVPALIILFVLKDSGQFHFFQDMSTTMLLMGAGLISGAPLMIFILGAKRISLSLIGILQYIYPTLIFLLGYLVYHESLGEAKLTGFVFIWIALVIYSVDTVRSYKKV